MANRTARRLVRGSARGQSALAMLVMASWLAFAGAAAVRAEPAAEEQDSTDWPTVISKLKQQMYQWPGHAETRRQLAVAYNNYGVSLGNQRRWTLAVQQLEEAVRLDGANQPFKVNLGRIYFNQAQQAYQAHQVNEAISALDQATTLNPDFAPAYALRGQIEYGRQRLKDAKAAWQRALELDPNQPELAKRLDQVTQELPVESQFERVSQSYFDLRYQEDAKLPPGFDLRDALLRARRTVGTDFACWPKYRLVVLIYSVEDFRRLQRETPEWVGGQFDGKIRVPIPGEGMDEATVTQILFHEYTHAVIHELTGERCPKWLYEGLAEYEGRTQARGSLTRLARASRAQQLIPWAELSDHMVMTRSAEDAAFAYEEAYSVASYLVTRYGFWRVRRLLKAIAEGRTWEQTMAEEFRMKLPKFEVSWREWLPELLVGVQ